MLMKKYIQEKLAERGLTVQAARVGLPETMEGKIEPVQDRNTSHYLEMKTKCQEEKCFLR